MIRKLQTTDNVVMNFPMILKAGTQATSLTVSSFTTDITQPDGTVVSNFTAPTITNPVSKGIYFLAFPSAANSPAFTQVNEPNPYVVTLDHPETDVEPVTRKVWIADRLPWEIALAADVSSVSAEVSSLQVNVSSVGAEVNSLHGVLTDLAQ